MQFSENWLKELLDINISTEELCNQMTMLGIEVDNFTTYTSKITGTDAVIKLDITPNRGDCFSILGIARDLSAFYDIKLKIPATYQIKPQVKSPFKVSVHKECPRYLGRYIDELDLKKETPPLIKERLKLSDVRSIDPIVDITNYVLLELGQPLHAFDSEKIDGNLIVRFAKEKEKLTALNEENICLNKDCLLIADTKKPIALGGIIGGLASGVSKDTKSIFLESAFFTPKVIRGKARLFGFHTEASIRFERGVDYNLQRFAIQRASNLIGETLGGKFGEIQEFKKVSFIPKERKVSLNPARINDLLGTNLSKGVIKKMLNRLGLKPILKDKILNTFIPSWRFDLSQEADLVEEIARLVGYDNLPQNSLKALPHKIKDTKDNSIRAFFKNLGYNEVINYSFIDKEEALLTEEADNLICLTNPISSHLSVMRSNLWSGLLSSFIFNANRGTEDTKLFEVGTVFKKISNKKILESKVVGGLISGNRNNLTWSEKSSKVDFFDLKGDIETFFSTFNQNVSFSPYSHPFLHPGKTSVLKLNNEKKILGYLGEINPKIAEKYDIQQDIFLFEILTEKIREAKTPKFRKYSKFPVIQRDLAFLVDKSLLSKDVELLIRKKAGKNLTYLKIFDVYEGKNIPNNKKSLAFSLIWQDKNRTLREKEVDIKVEKIVNFLSDKLKAKIRSE